MTKVVDDGSHVNDFTREIEDGRTRWSDKEGSPRHRSLRDLGVTSPSLDWEGVGYFRTLVKTKIFGYCERQ